jgi:ABC-type transporter Mla subunit MlaD
MKRSTKDKMNEEFVEQISVLVQAQQQIDDVEESLAKEIDETAAKNPDVKSVLEEARDLVEAENDITTGQDEALRKHLDHQKERDLEREWNPQAVIDEKIKEEQKQSEEQDLEDQIAKLFEKQ